MTNHNHVQRAGQPGGPRGEGSLLAPVGRSGQTLPQDRPAAQPPHGLHHHLGEPRRPH